MAGVSGDVPVDVEQEKRIFTRRRAGGLSVRPRPYLERAVLVIAHYAPDAHATIGTQCRATRDDSLYGSERVLQVVEVMDVSHGPEKLPTKSWGCVNVRGEDYQVVWTPVADGEEREAWQRRTWQWQSGHTHRRPYCNNEIYAQHLELRHPLQRAKYIKQSDACAGREVGDVGKEPARCLYGHSGFKGEAAAVWCLSAKQETWEVDAHGPTIGDHS